MGSLAGVILVEVNASSGVFLQKPTRVVSEQLAPAGGALREGLMLEGHWGGCVLQNLVLPYQEAGRGRGGCTQKRGVLFPLFRAFPGRAWAVGFVATEGSLFSCLDLGVLKNTCWKENNLYGLK